jgi:hypothetical protein
MKLNIITVVFFLIFFSSHWAQVNNDSLREKSLFQISGYDFIPDMIAERNWEEIIKEIFLRTPSKNFSKFDPYKNVYILFTGIKDLNELKIIHKDKDGQTDRIVDCENIFFIWIDDNFQDDYEINYEIKKRASALEIDFNSMKNWFTGKREVNETRGGEQITNYYYKILPLHGVVIPSDITIYINISSYEKQKHSTSLSFINHEISYFNFAIGISAAKGTEKSFLIKDKQVFISDKIKNDWQGKFILGFNIHPGRDIDDWNPSYKFWENEFWDGFQKRLNLFVGLEISSKPFDNLFAGIGLNITKDIQIIMGTVFANVTQAKNGESIGDINSVNDLKNYFPKKYEPKIFFGLNFSTSMITRMLGLGI